MERERKREGERGEGSSPGVVGKQSLIEGERDG